MPTLTKIKTRFPLVDNEEAKKLLANRIKKAWQNLITRQFKNEGEAIAGKRTGYTPWADRANPLPINDDNSFIKTFNFNGRKESVQIFGRPLLELSYPTLSTRYKRNVIISTTRDGVFNIRVDYPQLSKGADAGVHQEGYGRVRNSEGVARSGLPARRLNIESFRISAIKETRNYLSSPLFSKRVARAIRELIKNKESFNKDFPKGFRRNSNEIPF